MPLTKNGQMKETMDHMRHENDMAIGEIARLKERVNYLEQENKKLVSEQEAREQYFEDRFNARCRDWEKKHEGHIPAPKGRVNLLGEPIRKVKVFCISPSSGPDLGIKTQIKAQNMGDKISDFLNNPGISILDIITSSSANDNRFAPMVLIQYYEIPEWQLRQVKECPSCGFHGKHALSFSGTRTNCPNCGYEQYIGPK